MKFPLRSLSSSNARRGLSLACVLLVSTVSLRALDPAKSVFQYNLQNWSRNDGLPSDKITAITQTTDGYLWFGTQNGLVRFDGQEFTAVPVQFAHASSHDIKTLFPARRGGLYFSITGGGFGHYDGRTFSSVGKGVQSAADTDARVVLEARDGALWLGTGDDLSRTVEGQEPEYFNPTATRIATLVEDHLGQIWIGTDELGLLRWTAGKLIPIAEEAMKKNLIMAVATDRSGHIWVATQRGLRCFTADGTLVRTDLEERRVNTLLVDRHDVLWIGMTDGLARFHDGEFAFINKEDGLGSDYVTTLFEDAEGSIWIGRRDGLSQLSDLKFPIFSYKEGLGEGGGLTVTPSRRGGIWVTKTHGFARFDGQQFTTYMDSKILPNIYVKLGLEARNGDFYWVDGDKTISALSATGEIRARYKSPDWPEALAEDNEGVIAGIGPTLYRIKDGALQPYVFEGPTPEFRWFDNLAVGRDNALWVACYNGLFRVKDGRFERWSTQEGLSGNRVHFVFEDADGSVWAGLSTGLARIKDGKLRNITAVNGLYDNRIYAIVPDDFGYFWINSGHGIFRVTRENLNRFADGKTNRIECEPFDGLESVKFTDRVDQEYSGCRSADGRIWFPNPWGFVMIDPVNFVRNTLPPPVHIEQIRVDGVVLDERAAVELRVGSERVEFHFAALSYISPKKVRLHYRLDGFDPDWIEAGNRRSALYNLKPGTYTFRVQAANADGIWNTAGDEFAFELPPPFYRTAWFYALCGLGVVVGLFGAYGWKVRHYRIRQKKLQAANDLLEAKVAKRTDELANSLSLLKATLDSTADGILALDLAGKVISFNRHFLAMWGFRDGSLEKGREDDILAFAAIQVKDRAQFIARIREILAHPEDDAFDVIELKDGRTIERYCKPQRIEGKCVGIVVNFRDVTARKKAEAALAQAHKQLMESSRQAGMAEVATSVLHNVGNVLNSVNVSTTIVVDKVRGSKVTFVPKVGEMLQEHAVDLPAFLTSDPKGQKIPSYLTTLGRQLLTEQSQIVQELDHLRKNVEHIKEIVAMQQSYARVSGVAETVPLCELIEDALRMNEGALNRHDVQLVRQYEVQPVVTVERHKVMQVLVNLIRNAKYACDDSGRPDKQVIVRIAEENQRIKISVTDNGIGIPPENLTRIFAHGFTTRKDGHGFGLHSGALVAKEMGGALIATSDGLGHGATFTLELPLNSPVPA